MASDLFGFELLTKLHGEQTEKKEDVIVLLVHWALVKKGFRCLGIGDSKAYQPDEVGTELLPAQWNKGPNFSLRYIRNGKLFILNGTKSDEDFLLNLLKTDDHKLSNTQFPISPTVNELRGPLANLIPAYSDAIKTLETDLIQPVIDSAENEASTQTNPPASTDLPIGDEDFLRVPPPRLPQPDWNRGGLGQVDPLGVGRRDLDPLGGPGGGMLFDPFSMGQHGRRDRIPPQYGIPGGRLPAGAVPPGARFDPFGPPRNEAPRPFRPPDSDEFHPPGYDDMFM